MSRARVIAAPVALAALAALGLPACSGDDRPTSQVAVSSGNQSACPGEVLDVVVAGSQWTDVVRRLGGDCVTVTTVVASAAVDPHDARPGTADLAAFSSADLVVVNGAGYDAWAGHAVEALRREPPVVSAAEVAGLRDSDGDPHLWYAPAAVEQMAGALTEELGRLSPDAAPYFDGRHTAWIGELQPYLAAVAALRPLAAGRTYAATETVFDRMAAGLGLGDATPAGYRRSAGEGREPAPADVAEFEAALAGGSVDVLIHNAQLPGPAAERLVDAAEEAGVPVVDVTESPPDVDGSFVAWQLDQLEELSDALGAAR